MLSTALLKRLQKDHPQFSFVTADAFRWSADTHTIHFDPSSAEADLFILHELGHALLSHQSYVQDIDLLKMERDAWHIAMARLSVRYNVAMNESHIQDNLDTYREWLHTRSLCPSCAMSGLQTAYGAYSCLACGCRWKTNDARNCALRRYTLPTHI